MDELFKNIYLKENKLTFNVNNIKKTYVKSGTIFCKFCKSFNCVQSFKQTRSADEPMTIFNKCLECDKSFRMSS